MAPRSEDPKLIIRVINSKLVQPICSAYINVTDGQTTDRQTDGRLTIAIPRFALPASRGKKCTCLLIDVATRCMASKTWVEQYQMSFSNGLGEMGLGEMGGQC